MHILADLLLLCQYHPLHLLNPRQHAFVNMPDEASVMQPNTGDSDDTAPADGRLAPDVLSLPGTPSFKTNAPYDQAMSQGI